MGGGIISKPREQLNRSEIIQGIEAIQSDIQSLKREVQQVFSKLVIPGWTVPPDHGMPNTLYGFVMRSFSLIDLLSSHFVGKDDDQTSRMRKFMCRHVGWDNTTAHVAIKFWRHTLMHTASPRTLYEVESTREIKWLLHWGDEHLPRIQHMTLLENPKILNMSLVGLIEDISNASDCYRLELINDPKLQNNFLKWNNALKRQILKPIKGQ